jgi:hypothetical protein
VQLDDEIRARVDCPTNSGDSGSAFHGGMNRLLVTAAIWVARCFTAE